jgi:hypothetical protein
MADRAAQFHLADRVPRGAATLGRQGCVVSDLKAQKPLAAAPGTCRATKFHSPRGRERS